MYAIICLHRGGLGVFGVLVSLSVSSFCIHLFGRFDEMSMPVEVPYCFLDTQYRAHPMLMAARIEGPCGHWVQVQFCLAWRYWFLSSYEFHWLLRGCGGLGPRLRRLIVLKRNFIHFYLFIDPYDESKAKIWLMFFNLGPLWIIPFIMRSGAEEFSASCIYQGRLKLGSSGAQRVDLLAPESLEKEWTNN